MLGLHPKEAAMKISIYQTIEITDEQRKEIGALLGVKWPSRDQLKDFFWRHGENWQAALTSSTTSAGEHDAELDDLI